MIKSAARGNKPIDLERTWQPSGIPYWTQLSLPHSHFPSVQSNPFYASGTANGQTAKGA